MPTVAEQLRELGVKGILLKAAEQGKITELACQMPDCLCPRGRSYFQPVTPELLDWIPTNDHYPKLRHEGGKETTDNTRLAHRLCNRIDYSRSIGRPHEKDLQRVEKERLAMESEQGD